MSLIFWSCTTQCYTIFFCCGTRLFLYFFTCLFSKLGKEINSLNQIKTVLCSNYFGSFLFLVRKENKYDYSFIFFFQDIFWSHVLISLCILKKITFGKQLEIQDLKNFLKTILRNKTKEGVGKQPLFHQQYNIISILLFS